MIIVAPNEIRHKLSSQVDLNALGVQWCENIYIATATIFSHVNRSGTESETLRVFAWIDNLSLGQMKFFSVLAKNGKIVPIAFSDFSQEKLESAVEHGAVSGLLTEELPGSLLRHNRVRVEERLSRKEGSNDAGVSGLGGEGNDRAAEGGVRETKSKWSDLDVSLSREELDSLLLEDKEEMGDYND